MAPRFPMAEVISKRAWRWEQPTLAGLTLSSIFVTTAAALGPDLSVLAWIAIVPLLLALRHGSAFFSFCLGWFAGFLAYVGIAYWVAISPVFTTMEALVIPGYLGLHWGLFGAA